MPVAREGHPDGAFRPFVVARVYARFRTLALPFGSNTLYILCVRPVERSIFRSENEGCMEGAAKERWLQLCELAAKEQDSAKLLSLVREINRLLEEKDQRLKAKKPWES